MFLHASFLHLLFNMLVLHFSGRLFLTYFTGRQLFGVYILGGIFAGILYIIVYLFLGDYSQLIGASAAIYAVLFSVTIYAPYTQVSIFNLDFIKLWHICFFILFSTHITSIILFSTPKF